MKATINWMFAVAIIVALGAAPRTLAAQMQEPAEPPAGQTIEPAEPAQQPDPYQQPDDPAQSAEPADPYAAEADEAADQSGEAVAGLEQEGELKSVDADESVFLIVADNGEEMLFHYDDQTEVADQTEGVQGLAGQSGAWLKIQYRAEGDKAIAERIELSDRAFDAGQDAGDFQTPEQTEEPSPEPEMNQPETSPELQ
jgi:hypothetical protein